MLRLLLSAPFDEITVDFLGLFFTAGERDDTERTVRDGSELLCVIRHNFPP